MLSTIQRADCLTAVTKKTGQVATVVRITSPTLEPTGITQLLIRGVKRDSHGKIIRSESARHSFMRQNGYTRSRKGYVIDHIIPLKRGGCDCPSNMQWQTKEEARRKDKWE